MPPTTSQELAALSQEHQAIADFREKNRFYTERLYPALRDHFAAELGADPPIELLVIPVSNQHVPVLVAARWKPQRVYAIYSSRSVLHRAAIEAEVAALGLGIVCDGEMVPNIEVEPSRLYEAIKAVLLPYVQPGTTNPRVAVDITGGTSVMSVGAAMAVSLVGGRLFYILSAAADDDIQQRKVGTEQPRRLDDPYAVFGELEAAQATELYKNHDYADAARSFGALALRLGDAAVGTPALSLLAARFDLRARIALAYAANDAFDLSDAATQLGALHTHPELSAAARRQVAAHLAALAAVRPLVESARPEYGARDYVRAMSRFAEQQVARLTQPATAAALLATLYANALRRAEQERLDTAALLLYRCLELMSQQRLAARGVYTEWPHDPMERLAREFPRLRAKKRADRWKKIALGDGYEILQIIGDPFGQRCDLQRIRDGADLRNQSLLAHGFNFISSGEYDSFKLIVDEALVHWCDVTGINWAATLLSTTFLNIPDLSNAS